MMSDIDAVPMRETFKREHVEQPSGHEKEQDEDEEDATFSSASSRLKFIHAQMLDSSVDADNEEDAAAVVGTLANAMSISISNESARIENAVAISEMDMAIQNLEKWRQRQRRVLAEASTTAEDMEMPETDENESVKAILQRLASELGELDFADATNAINKPPPPRPPRPSGGAVDKVDLSRLQQQEALLVSASASATVAADADEEEDGDEDEDKDTESSSPESARLASLIAHSNANALLSLDLCSIEKALAGDEAALDEGMTKLADSLRSLEYDYDALLLGAGRDGQ